MHLSVAIFTVVVNVSPLAINGRLRFLCPAESLVWMLLVCCFQRWWTSVKHNMMGRRLVWLIKPVYRLALFVICREWGPGVFSDAECPWNSVTERNGVCFVVFSFLLLTHSQTIYILHKNTMNVCERTCHCATVLNIPTLQPRRCSALNRQWLIYGMIVYFAMLSVMDEDLHAFEKSVWNMVESEGRGLF